VLQIPGNRLSWLAGTVAGSLNVSQRPRVTPAMATGVVDTLWDMDDMLRVVENWEARQPTIDTERKA
jgi:hypothetical protein